ncbi:YvcK family protein [Salicibibacter halophilus]|uniref:Gluconeogenesis factor n=1 Tax=Salicibibacter halophilus TaxID=2502791 RepID=A0A514LMS7_9BACI|nr:YvcK family protein [Salicibibacter halophilus]QDI93123.1 YvcK family protein [Salicibibacter halophilus]
MVVIGGGTGLSVLLRGLKTYSVDLSAIVTVADDGGSSGRLRKELNVPPPGDVRNVLVALAEVEPLIERLFQHRFENGEGLSGHSLGNLLIAGMTSITGDFARGISELSAVLNVRGTVLPASNNSIELVARMTDGSVVRGESNIPKAGKKIDKMILDPEFPEALPASIQAIRQADKIIMGPGSLYTSVLPNLLVPGIAEEISRSPADKIYICNVMTQKGETDGFTASDHIKALHAHIGDSMIEQVFTHDGNISSEMIERYAEEGSEAVICDEGSLKSLGLDVVQDDFIHTDGPVLRHNAEKIARMILEG